MINFEYYTPTRVVFGKDAETQVGQLAKAQGATKVLVHFGGQSARESGLLFRVCASLKEAGLSHITFGGVVPNPRLDLVREGIELCRAEKVDFILAVGGGSVIDSAKAIGYGLANPDVGVWDFFVGKATPTGCAPIGAVLTLAAAGSEMSDSTVITNTELGLKRAFSNDACRPRFALLNPALTLTLPPYQTASGCADIFMHTLERYFTPETPMEVTSSMAEALLRTTMNNARTLTRSPQNYNARAEIMWAGSLSHNGLTGCGGGRGDWACHQLAHEITTVTGASHGASLTAIWGSWARYVYKEKPQRFVDLALNVLELEDEGTDEEMALQAIEEVEGFFWAIELPTSIAETGTVLTDEQIAQLAEKCSNNGTRTIGGYRPLTQEDMVKIYTAARQKD